MDNNATKILYVEDDPSSETLVRRVLESEGYQVVTVSDGLSAIKVAKHELPDLILMDINIGGLDGYEVTTRMRVSMQYNSYPSSCGTFTYGEVEDYTAYITGGCTQYTLTTNTVGNGSISLNHPGGTYCEGTVVTLTAVPDTGRNIISTIV